MKFKDTCLEVLVEMEGAGDITGKRLQGKMKKRLRRRLQQRPKSVGQRDWQSYPRKGAREEVAAQDPRKHSGTSGRGCVHSVQ